MDQRVQCPVCTLYLHSGMSLESHLDTHPKDQVIKALCNLSAKSTSYGSRTSTPTHSERSYRSRSRTPATEDSLRWVNQHRNIENERYWRRTPSRNKSSVSLASSRNGTPDIRMGNISFENNLINSPDTYAVKLDKPQQTYGTEPTSMANFDQQYPYYPEQQDDQEIKFSRSSEYTGMESANNIFTYNMPTISPGIKLQTTVVPSISKRGNDIVKIVPKQGNLLLKTNVGGVQYITPGVKPLHVVMPSPSFVQKNIHSNMIMAGNIPSTQILDPKTVASPINNQFNQISTASITPGTTVVTQNSQIIYREMVHNIDGKPFISSMPTVLSGHDTISNVAQSSSMYQNVMVVDQFGNTSCMYATPQQLLSKPCEAPIFNETIPQMTNIEKPVPNIINDPNKTLVIEVNPMLPVATTSMNEPGTSTVPTQTTANARQDKVGVEKSDSKNDVSVSNKGLKILSNIKVEVPVQHHKNMLNTVMDLTGPNETEYIQRPISPDKILPDLDENAPNASENSSQPFANSDNSVPHAFSVIKNVGNPPAYKEASKTTPSSKLDVEFSDSCPVPDLICNEKASISPCSELSEHGDNSVDHTLSPKTENNEITPNNKPNGETEKTSPIKSARSLPLRLNNIYVKKHKKILQIKNAKTLTPSTNTEADPLPSSSKVPENFTINKKNESDEEKNGLLQTISIEKIKENNDHNFDANIEEQPMDIEPGAPSSLSCDQYTSNSDLVKVKEEVNISNEFSNESVRSGQDIAPMETLRPINVITYGNMAVDDFDDDSNHRELLELEAASKSKQFVTMMNENYFGDNIYADYFTPDRVETFDAEKESGFGKDASKDTMYIWGEPSQKEAEFVLPNFIHESYKIAESGVDYSDMATVDVQMEGEGDKCERDTKAELLCESRSEEEPILNICTDETMPPRGELSGQESNGDLESPWSGIQIYSEVPPAETYDLIARESWVSDGSDVDANEKPDTLEEELHFPKRMFTCAQCGIKFPTMKELRAHKSLTHALPTCSSTKTTYSRMVTSRTIKKEEKPDTSVLAGSILQIDSKETISSTILQVYNVMSETKSQIAGLIKQETKRRRKDFVCPTCKEDQLTDAQFHAHLKIHPLECLTCGKCFFRRANLALHIKTHLGIKNYKCDICEKRFITRQKLNDHHNIHTGRAPIKCTVCNDTFRRYSNMVQHRDRHHFKKKAKVRDFVCHCGVVFHSKAKLLWHKETHEERPKACQYCSDKFVHAASLTRHVRRSHNEYYLSEQRAGKAENVPCHICKQVYLRTNLRAHLQTHTGERPYNCVICNKYFTTKWNLKLHRWTHMNRSAKPYKCNLCKGAFIRHTEYVSHMNAHKSVRPYTCKYCGCQFIRKYNCQRHVREHEMAKKYVCKVAECGKTFHRSYYLSEHMKVHSGVRPFSCNICGKTSSNKSNHNKHVKIHHAREPVAAEA